MIEVIHGDALEVMRGMPDESVHACVTDPPYGLAFMGKKWDYDVPGEEVWREVLRILKPGGFLLSFSGTRTYHRMTVRIEDAGFEIRDMIQWIYGSGFPKSHDVSKAIDKEAGVEFSSTPASGVGFMNPEGANGYNVTRNQLKREGEQTDAAKQWQGWGTALKPANEPICVARKPLIGTVAENVLAHGCGGLNIDACRVGFASEDDQAAAAAAAQRSTRDQNANRSAYGKFNNSEASLAPYLAGMDKGRWPANVVHDGSDEVLALFPHTGAGGHPAVRNAQGYRSDGLVQGETPGGASKTDAGSAARFFYTAKADRGEREKGLGSATVVPHDGRTTEIDNPYQRGKMLRNHHPTVKPVDLMRWLVRLVCPPGGTVLDPYTGSGTTGVACRLEGFGFIGIELSAEYVEMAKKRINAETPSLFSPNP